MAWQEHLEYGRSLAASHAHSAAVRLRNLLDDVEAEAGAARRIGGAHKRREDNVADLRRDRSSVLHLDPHSGVELSFDTHLDRLLGVTVLDRITNEICQHLEESIRVPGATWIAPDVPVQL